MSWYIPYMKKSEDIMFDCMRVDPIDLQRQWEKRQRKLEAARKERIWKELGLEFI